MKALKKHISDEKNGLDYTGAIPCYFGGSTRLGTQYTSGNVVRLTYRENIVLYSTSIPKGWWTDANYNTDTYDRIRIGTTLKAKTAIPAGRLAVADEEGCFPLAAGVFVGLGLTLNPMYGAAAMSLSSFCVVSNALRLNLCKLYSAKHDHKGKPMPEIHLAEQ